MNELLKTLPEKYKEIVFYNEAMTVGIMGFTQREFEELESYYREKYIEGMPFKTFQ